MALRTSLPEAADHLAHSCSICIMSVGPVPAIELARGAGRHATVSGRDVPVPSLHKDNPFVLAARVLCADSGPGATAYLLAREVQISARELTSRIPQRRWRTGG